MKINKVVSCGILVVSVAVIILSCKTEKRPVLTTILPLNDFPSGSGLAFLNNSIYLVGDDVPFFYLVDTSLQRFKTLYITDSVTGRIEKKSKPDYEDLAIIKSRGEEKVLMIGSGSAGPQRNTCFLFDPVTTEKQVIRLDTFYKKLKSSGIKDLNIEAATSIPSGMLLGNRGHKGYPKNYLIFADAEFWMSRIPPLSELL
jgi:hypothetical protein